MNLSRRDLLKVGLFSSAALMLPAERIARTQLALTNRIPQSQLPDPFSVPFVTPPVLKPEFQTPEWAYYSLEQRQVQAEILPGLRTTIWGYNGITPGPTIMNTQNQQAVVRQINNLPDVHPSLRYNVWTSTHLHGSCSLPQYDGYASDITMPGEFKDYKYPNEQDARTLWYHDHGVHITAENAYMGLAAQYILHDPLELSLPIPHGKYDVPIVLKDAMFQQNGDLVIDDNSESGIYGDVLLVNGKPWPLMAVEPRKYRFRFLNASVSRSYDLSLDTDEPLTVIGTDGGLMPQPQPVAHFKIGMAERYEVVIDFSKYSPGQRVVLKNTSPKNNRDFDTIGVVMAFHVGDHVSDRSNNEIPRDLNPNMNVMGLTEEDAVKTRHFRFERDNSSWTINGLTWEDVINSDYQKVVADPGLDDVEIWELENKSGGWFHPVHIHLVDFRVLDRNGKPPEAYEQGPKDVVYVGENETVRVIMRFDHHEGRYMMHCHNLVHEDHDMMVQFRVGSQKDEDPDDPIKGDGAKKLPAPPLFLRPDDDDDRDDDGGGSSSGGGGDRIREGEGNSQRSTSGSSSPSTPRSGVKGATDHGKTKKKVKKTRRKPVKKNRRDDRHEGRRRSNDRKDGKRRSSDRKGRKRRATSRRKRS
jgi:spore coat protein A, manganese oxidase